MKNRTKVAAVAVFVAALVGVAGCSQASVEGKLTDLRYVHAEWAMVNEPVTRRVCKTVTVTRTHTKYVNGKARSTTKVVPTTKCTKKNTGRTKLERQQVSPERWCLEVSGAWYEVSAADYHRAEGKKLGAKFKTPYQVQGC